MEFPEFGNITTGIINDSDGYVNIRKSNSISSQIIGRIQKNEAFLFHFPIEKDDKWVLVKTSDKKVGYVYFNRIYDLRKNSCIPQIELIDQNWETLYGPYGNRKIDSIAPNLKESKLKINYKNRAQIDKYISCGIANSDLFGENSTEKTIRFTKRTYKSIEGIELVLIEYSDALNETVGTVVSFIENQEIVSYLYDSNLETISIYAFEKVNGNYKLYGNLKGSPGDCYSGNFTLSFINNTWIYKFEHFEFNG
ncbi:MAG: SH3 domain-containing protein [Flavobacteriaceae bacterium]|nr:SH3 domain-containing protein [Flavobacteriaceae bacterium]